MILRRLELKDVPRMYEWMHDYDVVKNLGTNFMEKTKQDCEHFIKSSWNDNDNCNLAIADDNDTYMGTVSLKHIDRLHKTAEFAITVHHDAMGTGAAAYGMKTILSLGLREYSLENIYWCVNSDNIRAIRFYNKNGYSIVSDVPNHILSSYSKTQLEHFIWYCRNV